MEAASLPAPASQQGSALAALTAALRRCWSPFGVGHHLRKNESRIGGDPHAHYWNRVLQISVRPGRTAEARHDPYAPGLHHLCLQLRDVAAVDAAFSRLRALGVAASVPRLYPEYAHDYHASFFEDPDGIRLELVARRRGRDEIVARWDET